MSRVAVGTAEAGRPCPVCRFPLRHDAVAERCDGCGALYHEDCWREAGGCAVEGCAGGKTAVMPVAAPTAPLSPAVASPPPPAPVAPFPPAAAPPPPVAPSPNRGVVLGLLVGLALAGAGLAGYLVASGGDKSPSQRSTVVSTDAGPATATSPGETAPSSEQDDPQSQAMEGMARIVRLSLLGRTAVREGRYAEAIANRELVLQRLDALPVARGAVGRAQATLRDAMEASLASDRAYAEGRSAAASDRAATAYKRAFVAQWNPLAGRYGLEPYAESEI